MPNTISHWSFAPDDNALCVAGNLIKFCVHEILLHVARLLYHLQAFLLSEFNFEKKFKHLPNLLLLGSDYHCYRNCT